MLSSLPVQVEVESVALGGVVIVGEGVVAIEDVKVAVPAVEGHCEQTASSVRLLGEHTSKGTWASAQMKAQQGS